MRVCCCVCFSDPQLFLNRREGEPRLRRGVCLGFGALWERCGCGHCVGCLWNCVVVLSGGDSGVISSWRSQIRAEIDRLEWE